MEVSQGSVLDFTGQSQALCLQVERLTGSLVYALSDMADVHHCLLLLLLKSYIFEEQAIKLSMGLFDGEYFILYAFHLYEFINLCVCILIL